VLRVLLALGALALSAGAWLQTRSWWKGLLTALLCALAAFAKRVWAELEPQWTKRVAGVVDLYVTTWVAGYGRRYARHLYYKHRTFDVKGFSTQGKFALELEAVYVDLSVDPASAGAISQDPIRLPEDSQGKEARDIFAWLLAEPERPRNFAIVGPPGRGKTTLLKHVALVLAARKAPLKLTPVLLFLRDHAAAIGVNPEIRLAELVAASLKHVPPPAGWFERRLEKGNCLVMFDGLDEVADPSLRRKVVHWLERQVEATGGNRFLVSSRPNGYRENPLAGFTVLQVLPFSRKQVERFVRNWYLANEVMAHQKDDPGVRMEADTGANDLLARLRGEPTLQELAVNPLLLTLIATVLRYKSHLPERRVELFAEICEVFLGKRQQARGLELDLTPAKKTRVLRVLAYEMMCRESREIPAASAGKAIAETLNLVMPNAEPLAFLRMVEDASGLLLERESGIYGFAHLTFQEYLASLHIKEERLAAELCDRLEKPWWHETARLYAAQADASPILERCLASDRPSVDLLVLAIDCEAEALQLRGDLQEQLRRVTDEAVEDPDPERRWLAAEHMLARRVRNMTRVTDDLYVDTSPISHAEYQLFIDESRAQGKNCQPDHWNSYQFQPGWARLPVVGIRAEDASAFCRWLSQRKPEQWLYSLPAREDLETLRAGNDLWLGLRFFAEGDNDSVLALPAGEVLKRIKSDAGFLVAAQERTLQLRRICRRLLWFALWCGNDLARDRNLDRVHYLARDLARARDFTPALDVGRARALAFNLDPHVDHAGYRAFVLNWLCVIDKRAEGELPVNEALWLVRTRQKTEPASAAGGRPLSADHARKKNIFSSLFNKIRSLSPGHPTPSPIMKSERLALTRLARSVRAAQHSIVRQGRLTRTCSVILAPGSLHEGFRDQQEAGFGQRFEY
jgi:hypothetical protein